MRMMEGTLFPNPKCEDYPNPTPPCGREQKKIIDLFFDNVKAKLIKGICECCIVEIS